MGYSIRDADLLKREHKMYLVGRKLVENRHLKEIKLKFYQNNYIVSSRILQLSPHC